VDALMLLTADHNRIRGLLHRFNAAHEHGDVAQVGTLAERIVRELEVHTKIEEEIFYPAARAASEQLEEIVAEGIEEHHVVDHLITELGGLPSGADQWVAKMLVMIENVEHHAGEEEKEMFPQARSALDADTLADLAERLESRKAQLGAPTVADKEHLTLDELRKLAQAQEIPGRSDMNREQLLATVAPE
jgi:hemerythrin-like domain-containing protein